MGRWWLAVGLAGMGTLASAADFRFVSEPLPPYSYETDGRAAGPMVDVLQAACARLEWRCSVEILPWRRALRMAQAGEVEGMFSIVTPPMTARPRFHVSPPVVEGRYVLWARGGEAWRYEGDARGLAGRAIGVYGPSGALDALKVLIDGVAGAHAEVETDNRAVLRKLAAGRYGDNGLALINEGAAWHLIREEGMAGLQTVGVVRTFGYAFGLNNQRVDAATAAVFGKALQELCRSGRTAELLKPYGLQASSCVK
ncbi:MAG TPA: transporter substrate-binding domain-containing protein [Roseateles sp.]